VYIYNIAQLHLLRIQLTTFPFPRSENPLAFKGFLFLFCCPYHCPRYSALSSALHTDSENLLVSFTRLLLSSRCEPEHLTYMGSNTLTFPKTPQTL